MRLLLQHRTVYKYPRPAAIGPHLVRLRPATHAKATIETYSLGVEPGGELRWQQDPFGNHVARFTVKAGTRVSELEIKVELAVEIRPVNPFDFFIDDRAEFMPFGYPEELAYDLGPFFDLTDPAYARGERFAALLQELPTDKTKTVDFIVAANRLVNSRIRYVIREESGIWTPEQTLTEGRGSCRDSATLLIALLRSRGLATRFVSGYLVQLADEGMIPNQPKGVGRDVIDLHAWAEVYLPGAGWIGLDATSGLLCGEGHIPLACTATPALAAPVSGTADTTSDAFEVEMAVGRLGHEARPTTPYTEEEWQALLASGRDLEEKIRAAGLTLTMGGEPTFNARDDSHLPEWNGEALGPAKWRAGVRLVGELRERLSPGAAVLLQQGKLYPGESLPRWKLEMIGRRDGAPMWRGPIGLAPNESDGPWSGRPSAFKGGYTVEHARALAEAIARRLGLTGFVQPAFEDPWRFLQDEASLPVEVDPLKADLKDSEERRRLARVLDRGLGTEVGFVLPLARTYVGWASDRWAFRRGHLFLIPGESPMGLRLPLRSLASLVEPYPQVFEEPYDQVDPRREGELEAQAARQLKVRSELGPSGLAPAGVRTAVCVEPREGMLYVFLPPVPRTEDFLTLVEAVENARYDIDLPNPGRVLLEGYPPPPSPSLYRLAVTPDPGVLEVNLPPTESLPEYVTLVDKVFEAALHCGLHSEKYLIDGRMSGSGGGNHLTLGGTTALQSPFIQRPDLLASLLTFVQHHPSLSYMFTGLFVGPTSQAPRPDEARHEALYELEIALKRAHAARNETPPPWLGDSLFRHLLVDVSGNTHRTEVSIDKLFDWQGVAGRQGLLEFRAFEMPPHPRMVVAQMALVRALIAAFAHHPYDHRLARYGQELHDRFLLPYWLWRDFSDVLGWLSGHGVALPEAIYRPFLDLRCPLAGTLHAGDVRLEVRNAFEPWNVLGEELTGTGTSRYVDSSNERIEVRAFGFQPERHVVMVNGQELPMHPTGTATEVVAGVRFRAWAPPHSLHPHLGIHHPIRLDVVDTWAQRSLGGCAYHVWHPEGRAYDAEPLTRFEAAARRASRFTIEGPSPWPVRPTRVPVSPDVPYTLDLRRLPIDRPMPKPTEEE